MTYAAQPGPHGSPRLRSSQADDIRHLAVFCRATTKVRWVLGRPLNDSDEPLPLHPAPAAALVGHLPS